MRRGLSGCVLAAGVGLAVAAFPTPVAADWLVTRDGTRIEIRGPWEVKGKIVVFTSANGTFSSLRLSEVDLEASAAATARAKAPPEKVEPEERKPKPGKKPVLVLTDADVRHVEPRRAAETEATEAAEEPGESSPLEVVSWSEIDEPDRYDVQIFGTLRNNGQEVATEISVDVRLLDSDGGILGETPAILRRRSLAPGDTTDFRALFPGIYGFNSIRFDTRHASFKIRVPPEEAGEGGGSGEGGSPPGDSR